MKKMTGKTTQINSQGKISTPLLIAYVLCQAIMIYVFTGWLYNQNIQFFHIGLGYRILGKAADAAFVLSTGLLVYLVTSRPSLRFALLLSLSILMSILISINFAFTPYYNSHIAPNYISFLLNNMGTPELAQDLAKIRVYNIRTFKQYYVFLPSLIFVLCYVLLKLRATRSCRTASHEASTDKCASRKAQGSSGEREACETQNASCVREASSREACKHRSQSASSEKQRRRRCLYLLIACICVQGLGILSYRLYEKDRWNSYTHANLLGAQISGFFPNLLYNRVPKIEAPAEDARIFATDNQKSYTNALGKTGSSLIKTTEVPGISDTAAYKRLVGDRPYLNGIFQDKNILFIQLETFAAFMLGEEKESILYDKNLTPNIQKFMSESYQLKNLVHAVAQGHSSDATFSVMNGVTSVSDSISSYDWVVNPYPQDYGLAHRTKKAGYQSEYMSQLTLDFYKRQYTHPQLYGFDKTFYYDPIRTDLMPGTEKQNFAFIENEYFSKEEQAQPDYKRQHAYYISEISDDLALRFTDKRLKELEARGQKYFVTTVTLKPHVPFFNAPEPFDVQGALKDAGRPPMTLEGAGYIEHIRYMDSYFARINELAARHPNTVIILYGDHTPTGYYKEDLEALFGRKLSEAEFAYKQTHIIGAIHVPDPDNKTGEIKGLLKGEQKHIRSQRDIYRTTIDLFTAPDAVKAHYYGANLLSDESSYAINSKTLNVFTDNYTILSSEAINQESFVLHPENRTGKSQQALPSRDEAYEIFQKIKMCKTATDKAIREGKINSLFQR